MMIIVLSICVVILLIQKGSRDRSNSFTRIHDLGVHCIVSAGTGEWQKDMVLFMWIWTIKVMVLLKERKKIHFTGTKSD